MSARFAILLAVLLCISVQGAQCWTTVGDGIEYQYFAASGPNDVFVCRMARTNNNATIESCSAYGRTIGGREVISAQSARCDQAIGYWGQVWGNRNSVVCAINGDYEVDDDPTGVMAEGFIHSGSYDRQFGVPACSWTGFGWSLNRVPSIPDLASVTAYKQVVTYAASGNTQEFQGINRARGSDELVIYTADYDYCTHADNSGTEVVVRLTTPFLIKPTPSYVTGNVIEIRQGQAGANIPFDCIVLSATGSAATTLTNNVSIGAEVRVGQEPTFWDKTCSTGAGIDWTKMYGAVGGNVRFLRNGVIEHNYQAGMVVRNPRTCICYNADYVFFVVCDGRSARSVGWTNDEMGAFCLNTLGATEGVNLDGGGSSEMIVNGTIVNNPSDGGERAVVNGIMMVNVQAKQQNTTFTAGQQVTTTGSPNVRLGPGTNYASLGTVSNGTTGTIVAHALNGVSAKSDHWWNVSFSTLKGWVAESLLSGGAGCTAPAVTTHPSGVSVNAGQTASFSVAASGTAPLTYQWRKNGTNLTNGGDISGATSTTLQIANCEEADEANYSCYITNSCGSATSNNAWLDVNSGGGTTIILDEDQGTYSGTWSTSTGAGTAAYNGDYKYAITAATESAWYKWTPTIVTPGNYDVYIMYREGTNRPVAAGYTVYYNGGSQSFQINQTTGGGLWVLLGRFAFAAGTAGYVKLSNASTDTGKAVIADAAKFVSAGVTGPTITQQPVAQVVCTGSTASFTVAATGQGTLTYQWQKGGVNMSNGGHYSGVTTTTLTVTGADSTDVASYRCVVTDSNGSTNSNDAALSLKTATSITAHPQNQTVSTGATATFSVTAAGSGTLTYQWQKNSVNLSNGGHYSGVTTSLLTVSSCDSNDAASYRCVVTADCGSATSNNATLTISGGGTTVILDEDQGTYSGAWSTSTGAGTAAYNGDYKYAMTATTETAWYKWTPNLTGAGNYAVYVMFRSGSNRATNSPYTIYYNGGSQTYSVNQTINGGTWVLLGIHPFLAGTSGYVKLGNNTGSTSSVVVADAVKWVPQ
jgi:hypothetical protein